jgi:membrane protease YdiL (CAAX protease family)
VTIFAIAVGAFLGIIPIFLGQEPLPVSNFLFALYVTAFVEEFFFRAIIQGKLERALGQNKAWFYGGILFGLAHFTTNAFVRGLDIGPGIFMLIGQIIAGWYFGIIYMKTRSLVPSFLMHYFMDFRLGSIIARLFL